MPPEPARISSPLRATRIGAIARQIVSDDGENEVLAVFERSFYLLCPRGIVCIGVEGIGAGPINIEIERNQWSSRTTQAIATGCEGRNAGSRLQITGQLTIETSPCRVWLPPTPPPAHPANVRRGIAALLQVVASTGSGKPGSHALPAEGLARLAFDAAAAPESAVERAAAEPLAALRHELPGVLASGTWTPAAVRAATLLLGLGPGLTPSGDDLLGGIMLALSATGHDGLRDALWAFLEPELDALTVPISAMHLSAAADGMALEALHALRDDILAGRLEPVSIDRVAAIGHTSGWDAAAGIVLGLAAACGNGN